jgi:hypothetical protein
MMPVLAPQPLTLAPRATFNMLPPPLPQMRDRRGFPLFLVPWQPCFCVVNVNTVPCAQCPASAFLLPAFAPLLPASASAPYPLCPCVDPLSPCIQHVASTPTTSECWWAHICVLSTLHCSPQLTFFSLLMVLVLIFTKTK